MDPNFRPITKEGLNDYCQKLQKSIDCVNAYGTNCLKGFTKQTLTIGLSGMKKHRKSICGPNAPKADSFIQNTDWLNKDKIDELYTCASSSIQNMVFISKQVKNEDQIPQSCCSYWLTRRCMKEKLKNMTNEDKQNYLEKMTDDALTNLINFLCSKQNSVETCQKIMPEAVTRMEKTFKETKKGDRRKSESYLIPFLDVISEDGPK